MISGPACEPIVFVVLAHSKSTQNDQGDPRQGQNFNKMAFERGFASKMAAIPKQKLSGEEIVWEIDLVEFPDEDLLKLAAQQKLNNHQKGKVVKKAVNVLLREHNDSAPTSNDLQRMLEARFRLRASHTVVWANLCARSLVLKSPKKSRKRKPQPGPPQPKHPLPKKPKNSADKIAADKLQKAAEAMKKAEKRKR